MKSTNLNVLLILIISIFVLANSASANIVTVQNNYLGFANTNAPGSTFTRTINLGSSTSTGSASFTLAAFGDFNGANTETVLVSVEGFSLGRYLDSNVGNDLFNNASFGDVGTEYGTVRTATAIIDANSWSNIVADGIANITYTLDSNVDNLQDDPDEFLNASITYDNSSIPEPSAIALLGLGLVGIGFSNRKRKMFN